MTAISGLQVYSYINLGSIQSNPAVAAWTLLPCIRTESLDLSPKEIESNCRGANGFETSLPGLRSGKVAFTYLFSKTEAAFIQIKSDALLGTISQYAIMFGNILTVGEEGFVSPMTCVGFDITRDYSSVVEVSVTLKPYFISTVLPTWYTV